MRNFHAFTLSKVHFGNWRTIEVCDYDFNLSVWPTIYDEGTLRSLETFAIYLLTDHCYRLP